MWCVVRGRFGDAEGEAFLSINASEGRSTLLAGTGRPVKVRPLVDVLDEHGIRAVSFMKIDVEGYEVEVLRGFDLARFAPHHIVAEESRGGRNEKFPPNRLNAKGTAPRL